MGFGILRSRVTTVSAVTTVSLDHGIQVEPESHFGSGTDTVTA